MIIKSKAPFRIGLAGGGSDVDPYTTLYGGEVVNATIGIICTHCNRKHEKTGMVYIEVGGSSPLEYELGSPLPFSGKPQTW
jgi:D-glycero-alpha-D-manno-heptose-7-phosphate kinase